MVERVARRGLADLCFRRCNDFSNGAISVRLTEFKHQHGRGKHAFILSASVTVSRALLQGKRGQRGNAVC